MRERDRGRGRRRSTMLTDGGRHRFACSDLLCRWSYSVCSDGNNMSWVRAYFVEAFGSPGQ